MNLQLENKTALVTGSTRGIGFAIARRLSAEEATVILNGRSDVSVREAAAKIGGDARGAAADVSTAAGCDALVQRVPKVDILGVGRSNRQPLPELNVSSH
jgi:NAD(P)-dependent dehydrogenase (short-subunit alcohol dehydrogenase family)